MAGPLAMDSLRARYPWPQNRPDFEPIAWSLDAGGRHLVAEMIVQRRISVVLEIGVFLGGSTKTWIEASPDVVVIAVDSWPGTWEAAYAAQCGKLRLARQLERPDGSYHTFLSALWEYRHRVIPVRGQSPELLYELHRSGLVPDLVYLDADKSGREIEVCHELFPQAIITGDDWWWGTDRFFLADRGYPIRKPVREFCRRHNLYLRTDRHTWVIDREPPSLAYRLRRPLYHFKSVRRRLRGLIRGHLY